MRLMLLLLFLLGLFVSSLEKDDKRKDDETRKPPPPPTTLATPKLVTRAVTTMSPTTTTPTTTTTTTTTTMAPVKFAGTTWGMPAVRAVTTTSSPLVKVVAADANTSVATSGFTAYTFVSTSPSPLNSSNQMQPVQNRIVGGKTIDITVLPYQLSLRYENDHICGACIVSPLWALTAAHCVTDTLASQLSLRAGSSTIVDDGTGDIYQVERIVAHAQYNMYTTENDICALKVKVEFKFGPRVKALLLPELFETVLDYTYCTISGWGYTQEGGETSPVLQVVLLPIIPATICQTIYGAGVIKTTMICAGIAEGGQDACQGDSGGPMQCQGKLVGIVSWGEGCARKGYPGVYTRVASMRPWIDQVTGIGLTKMDVSTPAPKKKKGR